jgi:hypothetical protein
MSNILAELPCEVYDLFIGLLTRPNVQSVSFPFQDEQVWRMLVAEQVDRARRTGLHLQQAFGLSGPDSGLPFDTALWGGYVHIPYEGMCEGDLFVKPPWRGFNLNAANSDGDLAAAMLGKKCHYVLLKGEHKDVDSATRSVVAGWTLYASKKPYEPSNPFSGRIYDPLEPLPSSLVQWD